jgi:hypothetical protein
MRTDGQTNGYTDMTTLIFTFRNFAKAPKNCLLTNFTIHSIRNMLLVRSNKQGLHVQGKCSWERREMHILFMTNTFMNSGIWVTWA